MIMSMAQVGALADSGLEKNSSAFYYVIEVLMVSFHQSMVFLFGLLQTIIMIKVMRDPEIKEYARAVKQR